MILNDFRKELFDLLYYACLEDISFIKKNFINESMFSYTVYCDSGFTSFGSSGCTRKHWAKQTIELTKIAGYEDKNFVSFCVETFAAEWDYVNTNADLFKSLNQLTKKLRNADYDGELTGVYQEDDFDGSDYDDFFKFYLDIIIEVIQKLKITNIFNTEPFEKDLLLGLQFGDPDGRECNWVISVSKQVNSPAWHEKMLEAYKKWL